MMTRLSLHVYTDIYDMDSYKNKSIDLIYFLDCVHYLRDHIVNLLLKVKNTVSF